MPRFVTTLLTLTLAAPASFAQLNRQNIAGILGFENGTAGAFPAGWSGNTTQGIRVDEQTAHSGSKSVRIERDAQSALDFSTILASIPTDFTATSIQLRGWVKTEDVRGAIALWIRLDGASGTLAFDSLQSQNINGTADWKQYSVRVNVAPNTRQVVFGFFLLGTGKAWADTLELLADGKPVAEAPARPQTILETDTEFDAGSKITLASMDETKVANLALLARVWGFVKYHHPAVTTGKRHWDYDLFRVMPPVLAATSLADAESVIQAWIAALGAVPECQDCATLSRDEIHTEPELMWIQELGPTLRSTLESIHRNRTTGPQFFVEKAPFVGNPAFDRELNYPTVRFPDSGYQLLALFRMWSMMQYFNPNREIMPDDGTSPQVYWNRVLVESIAPFALARDGRSYQQELLKFITKINDTHSNLWTGIGSRPPLGACYLPVDTRFAEGRPIVIRNAARNPDAGGPLRGGDIFVQLDGKPVDQMIEEIRPFYAASNDAARFRDIATYLTRGACGKANVTIDRDGKTMDVEAERVPVNTIDTSRWGVHDLTGPVFQKLADDIAYLKLSEVRSADSASYVSQAQGSKGLIIDIRNYPLEFVVFTLGGRLVDTPSPFVRFTEADLSNPGAFHFRGSASLTPIAPRFTGKVVILVDEMTQSQAEYTAMAFRTVPGSIVLGSTTAGADGNVSLIPLPGAQSSYISGIGVFYPDKAPTQRVGIIPDVEVLPTVAGIRAGRDELIEEAVRRIRQN